MKSFQPRLYGSSKPDLAILWDFMVSLIHTATLRLLPRRAISFGLVGASGVMVQLLSTALLMGLFNLAFQQALPVAVIGGQLELSGEQRPDFPRPTPERTAVDPGVAEVPPGGLPAGPRQCRPCHEFLHPDPGPCAWAQLAGIVVVYVWNYAASSRFVWNSPKPAWLPIGLGSLLRLVQIWMPVLGVHSWRQVDTVAMARHFSLAGSPIWLPQVDWGGASAGFVESEFPHPFLVSRLYNLMGVQEWLGRGLSVFCSALTIWLVMRLGRRWFSPGAVGGRAWPLPLHRWGCISGAPSKPKPCCCSVPQGPWRAWPLA